MRIPTRFKLLGETITVRYDPELRFADNGNIGKAAFRTNTITLQPSVEGAEISQEIIEQTFCHELIHFILYVGGEDQFDPPLHQREFLVDRLAGLLNQALTTAEYDDG